MYKRQTRNLAFWVERLLARRLSRNETILWLTVIITETYGMETFRLKIVVIGAFASYVTMLLLLLTERARIVPLTAEPPTRESLHNIDQIIYLMSRLEPIRGSAKSVEYLIHR